MFFLLIDRILRYYGVQPNHKYDRLMAVTFMCVLAFFVLLYFVMR